MLRTRILNDASPARVSQKDLIALSAPAKVIPLDAVNIKSLQAGSYISLFKGRGMEFDESRPYQPGDDPRNIDWRVTARSNQPYTKLYREERERPVYVVTDLRNNMHFATRGRFKSVTASYVASCLAWASHHRGDRLGGIIFGDNSCTEIRPKMGRRAVLRYLHSIAEHPDWDLSHALEQSNQYETFLRAISALRRVVRPGSLVIIISDFLGFREMCYAMLAKLSQHNELLTVSVSDPIEMSPPPPGNYRLVCGDQERSIETYSTKARNEYSEKFNQRHEELSSFFRRYGIHNISISTDQDPIDATINSLGKRVN